MRRLVVAVLAVVLAISFAIALTGCGSDQPAAEEAAVGAETEAPTPPPTAADAGTQPPEDVSPVMDQAYEPLPRDPEIVPSSVLTRLEAGQPMLIYFFDSEQPATEDQSAAINDVMADNRGLIELVRFDLGKYTDAADGDIEVDEKMLEDAEADKAMKLASELGVGFTPFVAVVDENGYTVFRGQGLVDNVTLEQQILRIGE